MKKLKFDSKYEEIILSGKKRSTIRIGHKKEYEPGDLVEVYAGDKFIGLAKVKGIKYLKWKEIDDEIAKKDGFKDKEELKRELEGFYGEFGDEVEFTQIEFEMI